MKTLFYKDVANSSFNQTKLRVICIEMDEQSFIKVIQYTQANVSFNQTRKCGICIEILTRNEQIILKVMKQTQAKFEPHLSSGFCWHLTLSLFKQEFIICCQFSPVEDLKEMEKENGREKAARQRKCRLAIYVDILRKKKLRVGRLGQHGNYFNNFSPKT